MFYKICILYAVLYNNKKQFKKRGITYECKETIINNARNVTHCDSSPCDSKG